MRSRLRNMIALAGIALAIALPPAVFAQPAPAASSLRDSGTRPGDPSDESLTHDVKHTLDSNPVTRDANIRVSTQDRMVTLSGNVGSRKVAQTAQQLAAKVNGVRGIENYMRYPSHD